MNMYHAFVFTSLPLELYGVHPPIERVSGYLLPSWKNSVQSHQRVSSRLPTPDIYIIHPPTIKASDPFEDPLLAAARGDFSGLEVCTAEYPSGRVNRGHIDFPAFVQLLLQRRIHPGHLIVIAQNGCSDYLAEVLRFADYEVGYQQLLSTSEGSP